MNMKWNHFSWLVNCKLHGADALATQWTSGITSHDIPDINTVTLFVATEDPLTNMDWL